MTDRHDGPTVDLERELVRYLAEHRISRRVLLERIGALGAAAALAPVIAACSGSAASSAPVASAAPSTPGSHPPSSAPSPSAAAEPTPAPTPEGELSVFNWADYMGEDVVPSFEAKYNVKVTYDFFDNYDT